MSDTKEAAETQVGPANETIQEHKARRTKQLIGIACIISALLLVSVLIFVLMRKHDVPQSVPPLPQPPQSSVESKKADVYYKNCSEARAAGVTPLHKGEPGYRPGLDRDGDGIACE